jgi:hypothetical protein
LKANEPYSNAKFFSTEKSEKATANTQGPHRGKLVVLDQSAFDHAAIKRDDVGPVVRGGLGPPYSSRAARRISSSLGNLEMSPIRSPASICSHRTIPSRSMRKCPPIWVPCACAIC